MKFLQQFKDNLVCLANLSLCVMHSRWSVVKGQEILRIIFSISGRDYESLKIGESSLVHN